MNDRATKQDIQDLKAQIAALKADLNQVGRGSEMWPAGGHHVMNCLFIAR